VVGDGDRESLLLAVLFHDPPWKPWGIHGDKIQGRGAVWQRLLDSFKRSGDPLLVKVVKGFEQGGGVYEEFRRCASNPESCRVKKHELQSLLLVMALTEALREEKCDELAGIVEEAARMILREDPQVKRADALASALDRVLLYHVLRSLGLEGMQEDDLRLVNPFNPRYKTMLKPALNNDDKERLAQFVAGYSRLVARLVRKADCDKGYLVHAAFALLEPAWYHYMAKDRDPLEYAPPADTRIPTHTVFDHVNVALATALWTGEPGEPKGCLVTIDLAGVQSWIAESRRLRDLWATSWLASLLAWKSVEPFVQEYGPGVLLQPPARLHPFYASNIILSALGNDYEKVLGGESEWVLPGLGLPLGWPVDPTVPSRVTIALPPEACKDAENKILENYRDAWHYILRRALAAAHPSLLLGGKLYGGETEENEMIRRLRSILEKLEPPLAVRVYKVDVADAYRQAKKAAEDKNEILDLAKEYLDKYAPKSDEAGLKAKALKTVVEALTGSNLAEALFYQEALWSMEARETGIAISASGRRTGATYAELYNYIYEKTEGRPGELRACEVCGVAPAVFYQPSTRRPAGAWAEEEGKAKLRRRVWSEIGEEALCPYCYVKRVLRTLILHDRSEDPNSPVVSKRLTGLPAPRGRARAQLQWTTVSRLSSRVTMQLDTLSRIVREAASMLLEALIGEAGSDVEKFERILLDLALARIPLDRVLDEDERRKIAEKLMGRLREKYGDSLPEEKKKELASLLDEFVGRTEYVVMELLTDEAYKAELERLLARVIRDEEEAGRLAERLDRLAARYHEYARRYTILRADGDYMGKILTGSLALEKPGVDPDRVRSEYGRRILNIHKQRSPKATVARLAMMAVIYALARYAESKRKEEKECSEEDDELGTIQLAIPTPSYHMTVSRSLAMLAMLDRARVEDHGGMVVYAGGDDLLAIVPPASKKDRIIYDSLLVAAATRRHYWGVDSGAEGFNSSSLGVAPGLNAYGRTYTLHYADLKRPMWIGMRLTASIEESKDSSLIKVYDEGRDQLVILRAKDMVFVSSDAGGLSTAPALLEAKNVRGEWEYKAPVEAAARLLSMIDSERVSTSLLYDAIGQARLVYTAALRSGGRIAALELLRSLVERNARDSPESILEALAEAAVPTGRMEGLVDYRVEYKGLAAGLALDTGYAWPDENEPEKAVQILAYSILGAARTTRSGVRKG